VGTNEEVVRILAEIADLLEVVGEEGRFKVEAYRRASRSLESLGEDLRGVAERGELEEIPGVGEAIAEKIREYLKTGHLGYYERLRERVPPGVLEIMRIPGVGPKTARRFLTELQVDDPAKLAQAIAAGRLTGMAGFGPKKIEGLTQGLQSLGLAPGGERRRPILEAWETAERTAAELRAAVPGIRVEIAGSLRRARETIGDLDLLATGPEPARIFDAFSALPGVQEVRLRGDTKETVIVAPGLQIDLRVVPGESFGAGFQYFTGSKDHNIRLRTLARDRGLKINEYGVYRGAERIAGRTEEEMYAALELDWMPPEIRENRGEIEAAQAHRVPKLLEARQLRGDLGVRPSGEPSPAAASAWAEAARAAGLSYVGVVLPAGSSVEATARRWQQAWSRAEAKGAARLFVGLERDPAVSEDVPEGIGYLVAAAPATNEPPEPVDGGAAPLFLDRLPPPGPLRGRWVAWTRRHHVGLEVNPYPGADGPDGGETQLAIAGEVPLFVSSRARRPEELDRLRLGVHVARRGWVEDRHVANTRSFAVPGTAVPRAARARTKAKLR
jgi:DNA polymerase (family 10)